MPTLYSDALTIVNSVTPIDEAGLLRSNCPMGETVYDIRRKRLQQLRQIFESYAAIARLADTSPAYLNQIANGHPDSRTKRPRTMGDEMARKLEAACGKPSGWMDQDDGALSEEAATIARMFDQLPEAERLRLGPVIRAALGVAVPDEQVEQRMPITKRTASTKRY